MGPMETWIRFLAIATITFVLIAGTGAVLVPTDVVSTLPTSVLGFLVCWPVAYWVTYRRSSDATA